MAECDRHVDGLRILRDIDGIRTFPDDRFSTFQSEPVLVVCKGSIMKVGLSDIPLHSHSAPHPLEFKLVFFRVTQLGCRSRLRSASQTHAKEPNSNCKREKAPKHGW